MNAPSKEIICLARTAIDNGDDNYLSSACEINKTIRAYQNYNVK